MTAAVAALVTERGGSVALADVSIRPPRAGEILVRIAASGVCPTDLFAIDGGAGDGFPAVFGHEGAGVVEAVGEGVTRIRPGDRVVLSFDSCGVCPACTAGHSAYCARFAELNYAGAFDAVTVTASGRPARASWLGQSSWATRVLARESNAVAIGADVPWAVAATLGCGVLTGAGAVLNVLRPGSSDSVLVIGAGTTGLAAVIAARHRGVSRIIVVDPVAQRRTLALELGADAAVAPGAELPRDITHALDTVGTQDALDAALGALAVRGTCATVALKPGGNRVAVSQSRLLWGRTLRGVIEGDATVEVDIPLLAALWRAGRMPLERIITEYPFSAAADAVADARAGRVVKAVLRPTADADARTDAGARGDAGAGADLLTLLRDGAIPDEDLTALWASLPAVDPAELRGIWRGWAATRRHPARDALKASGWYGKLFTSAEDVEPIIRRDPDGSLVADRSFSRGGARLLCAEHAGILTAAMAYDHRPIVDLFVRLAPGAVLGVMTGRGTDAAGLFHFVLEKDEVRAVAGV